MKRLTKKEINERFKQLKKLSKELPEEDQGQFLPEKINKDLIWIITDSTSSFSNVKKGEQKWQTGMKY